MIFLFFLNSGVAIIFALFHFTPVIVESEMLQNKMILFRRHEKNQDSFYGFSVFT